MDLIEHAFALAAQGIPVFPLSAQKTPMAGSNGHLDATTDPFEIMTLFGDERAALIGVPTGAASGIAVLDVDPPGRDWMADHLHMLPSTRTHRTRRDGFHLLFKHQDGFRGSVGKIAPGIDIRAEGNYIVWWPAAGYGLYDDSEIADAPDWLVEQIHQVAPVAALSAPKNPEDLAPPDALAVIYLLRDMPNPAEATRDDYLAVNLAAQGCIRSGLALGRFDEEAADAIKDAAAAWSSTWEGDTASDWQTERDKWERDWSRRENDVSGWRHLLNHARRLGADVAAYDLAEAQAAFAGVPLPAEPTAEAGAALVTLLSAESWMERDIPEPDRLLGDVLTTTTRVFIVGRTGLGKTMLGLGIAAGVASGTGFLHWPAGRPARVLYIDGEMPPELIKPRLRDAIRRLGDATIAPGNLMVLSRDIEKEVRRIAPSLPPFEPLNTEGGKRFLFSLLGTLGGVDLLIFDNVMSLLTGDQKDEVAWSGALPLVQELTDRRIGQIWLDHTGHTTDRIYGSSTKTWRFDAAAIMTPIPGKQANPHDMAFKLAFDKCRRRMPDNWQQFAPQIVRLANDRWSFEPAEKPDSPQAEKLRPAARAQYDALLEVLANDPTASGIATRDAWYAECARQGLSDAVPADATYQQRDAAMKGFRSRMSELKVSGWIAIDGDNVSIATGFR